MLLKFRTDKGRDPSSDNYSEDAELLLQIRNDVLDSLGVSPDLLPDDFVRLVSEQPSGFGVCLYGDPKPQRGILCHICQLHKPPASVITNTMREVKTCRFGFHVVWNLSAMWFVSVFCAFLSHLCPVWDIGWCIISSPVTGWEIPAAPLLAGLVFSLSYVMLYCVSLSHILSRFSPWMNKEGVAGSKGVFGHLVDIVVVIYLSAVVVYQQKPQL